MTRFALARIILFAQDVPATAAFYNRVFALPILGDAKDSEFIELDAGGCRLAVHRGKAASGGPGRPPKIVFRATNVGLERQRLMGEELKVTGLMRGPDFEFCETTDPAGNVIQVSSRP